RTSIWIACATPDDGAAPLAPRPTAAAAGAGATPAAAAPPGEAASQARPSAMTGRDLITRRSPGDGFRKTNTVSAARSRTIGHVALECGMGAGAWDLTSVAWPACTEW